MTNQERLALAEKVQKNIQQKFRQYRIFRRKEQIEKEYKLDHDGRKKISKNSNPENPFSQGFGLRSASYDPKARRGRPRH